MLFNNKAANQDKVNVETAYMLWRGLVDRNITIEHFGVLKNFIFDRKFDSYVEKVLKEYQKENDWLNKTLNKYSIAGPNPSPSDQTFQANSEVLNDQGIAEVLYRFMRLDINLLMLCLKEIPTNEDVFSNTRDLAISAINRINDYIEFLKSKGWLYLPPEYRHSNPNVSEKVAINEIFLLHDHLIFRYNNIRLTQILSVYVSDQVFNAMLTAGVKMLQSQVKELEDKLSYYGVILPKSYPSNTIEPKDKDMYEDRFIFNQILRGMQDAVALHGSSIQEIITNDKLRRFFIKLTQNELFVIDKMIKYGKLKGWTFQTPSF